MSIAAIGDVHGWLASFNAILHNVPEEAVDIIQLGDLGLWPDREWLSPPRPLRFIGGNHDYEPELVKLTEPTEVRPGLTYMPRGWIQEIDGRLVGFLGGADSMDLEKDKHGEYLYRTPGVDWWPSESITEAQVARLRWAGKSLDLLVTHCPPASVVRAVFGKQPAWSALQVERAWEQAGYCSLVCGHMHQYARYDKVIVLDEMQTALV